MFYTFHVIYVSEPIKIIVLYYCIFSCKKKNNFSIFTNLTQASKTKGCETLAEWVEQIRNHFWHCAETCAGDRTKLKVVFYMLYF